MLTVENFQTAGENVQMRSQKYTSQIEPHIPAVYSLEVSHMTEKKLLSKSSLNSARKRCPRSSFGRALAR